MSSGGVFQLIANDGKADELIMASCLLKSRIAQIKKKRAAAGEKVVSPTLADLERTHVLFMHASFKPFAAFGMEYRKITPEGSVGYDSELQYNIPQAGDFFSDFGIRFTVSEVTSTASLNFVDGVGTGDDQYNDGTNVVVDGSGNVVANGQTLPVPVAFASYPGERIVESLSISVNANNESRL